MRFERKTAITVGVLYIAATVAGVLSMAMGGAGAPAQPTRRRTSRRSFVTEFFVLVMAITIPGIAIMFYPVLRRDADTSSKQGLALWYVATRITEGTLFLVGILLMLSLLALSQEMARAGAASAVLSRGLEHGTAIRAGLLRHACADDLHRWRRDGVLAALRVEAGAAVDLGVGSHRRSAVARR